MNYKFHMQHDLTPRLQNSKIKSGREFKMAAVTKNSKTIKIVMLGIFRGILVILKLLCCVYSLKSPR